MQNIIAKHWTLYDTGVTSVTLNMPGPDPDVMSTGGWLVTD